MREGICVAGNLILDVQYQIESYPRKSELTTIKDGISRSTGGAVCNVGIDLAILDKKLQVYTLGIMGDDAEADFIEQQLEQYENIDIGQIKREGVTSFTVVMNESATKTRTYFQYRGANVKLCEKDFIWEKINAKILHIGYILLLDALDQPDEEYGTKLAGVLARAQKEGIKTSIDVVTEVGNRFEKMVPPALKYTDYCVINELEAQEATGKQLRDNEGNLLEVNMMEALQKLFSLGVSTWAVIHAPEGGYGMDRDGCYIKRSSINLPDGFIKGTVGAGDAFCAGVLYAAYNDMDLTGAIELGIAAASCSLSKEGATEGVLPADEAMKMYRLYQFK